MKLFTELVEDVQLISEAKESGGKDYYIEGIFLQSRIKNKNGRIYPEEILENEVSRYVREVVNKNRAFGELGHPSGPAINLDRVSHIITELRKEGPNFFGKAKLSKTPMGEIARGIMESGGQLGVSSRAMGSLKEENGAMIVQKDLRLSTAADIVADPSAPQAFVKGIMEGVEWVYNPVQNTWLEQKLYDTRKSIHKMHKNELEEKRLSIFEDYLASLAVKSKII
jgi:hypothetical protein